MMQGSNDSEDGDAFSSVSTKMTDNRPSVIGLRDRLLREARSERQRCLEVAEAAERRRAELRGLCNVAIQTDPVFVMNGPGSSDASMATAAAREAWCETDDLAQTEALRTIQMLGNDKSNTRQSQSRLEQLEEMLRAERAGREELDAQVAHERTRKEAAQQQVLCLEYELDGKEAALQVAERALERRDTDLQQAQLQLRALQEDLDVSSGGGFSAAQDDARLRALRAQLAEREQQIEQKDAHISRLLNVLRQHRSVVLEEDSTMCGSDHSMPASMSTVTTNGLIRGM